MKDEAEAHRPGRGSVGDVVFPGGQRQGRLIELHEDREHRLASAVFFGLVYLVTFAAAIKIRKNVTEQHTDCVSAYMSTLSKHTKVSRLFLNYQATIAFHPFHYIQKSMYLRYVSNPSQGSCL